MRLDTPEDVEHLRRSIAMLAPGAPALDSHEASLVLGQLRDALTRVRHLDAELARLQR